MVKNQLEPGWTLHLPPAGSGVQGGACCPSRQRVKMYWICTHMNMFNYPVQNAAPPPTRRSILLSIIGGGKPRPSADGLSALLPSHASRRRALARAVSGRRAGGSAPARRHPAVLPPPSLALPPGRTRDVFSICQLPHKYESPPQRRAH